MIKKILILFFLMLSLSSCVNFALAFLDRNNEVEKGEGHYKYKCEKVGQCCEIGKDCKEKESKK